MVSSLSRFHKPRPHRNSPPMARIRPNAVMAPDATAQTMVDRSPAPTEFPSRVILISDKNFASINTKMVECLKSVGIDAVFLHALMHKQSDTYVQQCFDMDHAKILVIYYDPGNIQGTTHSFTHNLNAPPDVPWCLLHGSSMYRVDNIRLEMETARTSNTARKGMFQKRGNSMFRMSASRMKQANKFFDSLTPLVMCGTEDLLAINPKSVFLGQPMVFEPFNTIKIPNKIGHITTGTPNRTVKKGTDVVEKAFDKIDFMGHGIIGYKRVPQTQCMSFLDSCGIAVSTMTTWDYGMGYTTLEALSKSCLVMSKNSTYAPMIQSPIVNVNTANDIVKRARAYHDNHEAFDNVRKAQYDWAVSHFSNEAVANRFKDIVNDCIKNGWCHIGTKYRGFHP